MEDLKACRGTYLIQPIYMEAKTKGGVLLPERSVKDPLRYGVIVAKGEGLPEDPAIGDLCYFSEAVTQLQDFDENGHPTEVLMACPIECTYAWKRVTKRQLENMLSPSAVLPARGR